MKELFESMWWGGKYQGYHEAAKLANHYVNGGGESLRINPDVYKESIIVSDVMIALKSYIKERIAKKKPIALIKTSDSDFLRSGYALPLKPGKRSAVRQGYLISDGALLVEQSNSRLKNADHRFHLHVSTTKSDSNIFMSRWSIKSVYNFEPFEKNHITDIALTEGFILELPDGLSHYLTTIGVAMDFKYTSGWNERWIY